MKTRIFALSLFVISAIGFALFPSLQQAQATAGHNSLSLDPPGHRIEVVFVLDTTSSMSGLIQAAKEKVWSIATSMASAQQNPDIKIGLVAFRDRGDDYVTRLFDLSNDIDSIYASLMDFKAEGGGDGPESVNQALDDAINRISWSPDADVYKVAFLIGDAPPHMDYANDIKFPDTLVRANQKGIIVNTIQSGQNRATTPTWETIAQLGQGSFFQVEDSGNAVAVKTPFDKKLAELAGKLEQTRLYYGDDEAKKAQQKKQAASAKLRVESSEAALARRATFNATGSGKLNFLGEGELVDAITSGRIALEEIDKDDMPASLQAMAPKQQKELIEEQAQRRDALKQEIEALSDSRTRYIKKQVGALGGAAESLDEKIYSAVKKQARTKGLIYDSDAASY